MPNWQPSILAPPTAAGRFITLGLTGDADPRDVARRLGGLAIGEGLVAGIGEPLARALGAAVPGLRAFPVVSGPGGTFPSTQGAAWLFVGGTDPGEILDRSRRVLASLGDFVRVDDDLPSSVSGGGRDLSGFEDGTENPKGERAIEVAFGAGAGDDVVLAAHVPEITVLILPTKIAGQEKAAGVFLRGRFRIAPIFDHGHRVRLANSDDAALAAG